ncbi:MAG: MATE family efflux transporter [Candidatus Eremiobacteraeota bacterium]|nr:MATE family efflux transporter [Candidatus Eremiobacteraeota bacterium]
MSSLLSESPARALHRLAAPLVLAMALETAFNLVDGLWVGRAGTDAFAALNLSSFFVWLLYALIGVVSTGTNSLVAQRLGAGRPLEAARVAQHGLRAGVVLGFLVGLPVAHYSRAIAGMLAGTNESVRVAADLGAVYLGCIFLLAPVHCLNETMASILRAYGDTRTPTKIYAVGFALNFLLDPLFIFGVGPFPRWGVLGAAVATNFSFLVVAAIFLQRLARGRLAFVLPTGRQTTDWSIYRGLIGIGLPPSISNVIFCLVYMAVSPAVGAYGPQALAALGIGHRVLSLSFLLCYGYSLATITLVGHNAGAGQMERACQCTWEGVKLVLRTVGPVGLSYLLLARQFSSCFSSDPTVIAIATSYLRIISFSQVLLGVSMVIEGAFAGFGRTIPPTTVSIATTVARVPGVHLVGDLLRAPIRGLWWVFSLLTCARGLAMVVLFHLYSREVSRLDRNVNES